MKKTILLACSMFAVAITCHALQGEWFTWCYSGSTPDTCANGGQGGATGTNPGDACQITTNPRMDCGGGPVYGCNQGGSAVTLTVLSGTCNTLYDEETGAPYTNQCIGTTGPVPGTANC